MRAIVAAGAARVNRASRGISRTADQDLQQCPRRELVAERGQLGGGVDARRLLDGAGHRHRRRPSRVDRGILGPAATALQRTFNTGSRSSSYDLDRKGRHVTPTNADSSRRQAFRFDGWGQAAMTMLLVCMPILVATGWATYELQRYAERYVAEKHAND
jgi:hypothetical protein